MGREGAAGRALVRTLTNPSDKGNLLLVCKKKKKINPTVPAVSSVRKSRVSLFSLLLRVLTCALLVGGKPPRNKKTPKGLKKISAGRVGRVLPALNPRYSRENRKNRGWCGRKKGENRGKKPPEPLSCVKSQAGAPGGGNSWGALPGIVQGRCSGTSAPAPASREGKRVPLAGARNP